MTVKQSIEFVEEPISEVVSPSEVEGFRPHSGQNEDIMNEMTELLAELDDAKVTVSEYGDYATERLVTVYTTAGADLRLLSEYTSSRESVSVHTELYTNPTEVAAEGVDKIEVLLLDATPYGA